jgi:hypothetical protein
VLPALPRTVGPAARACRLLEVGPPQLRPGVRVAALVRLEVRQGRGQLERVPDVVAVPAPGAVLVLGEVVAGELEDLARQDEELGAAGLPALLGRVGQHLHVLLEEGFALVPGEMVVVESGVDPGGDGVIEEVRAAGCQEEEAAVLV